jgi:hypothetical protein
MTNKYKNNIDFDTKWKAYLLIIIDKYSQILTAMYGKYDVCME